MLRWQLKIKRLPHCSVSWRLNLDNVRTLFWCDFHILDAFKVLDIINKIDNDSGCLDFKVIFLTILWQLRNYQSLKEINGMQLSLQNFPGILLCSVRCVQPWQHWAGLQRGIQVFFCAFLLLLFVISTKMLDQGVSGCLARTRRGQSQQMRSSEAFLHELLWSLCQKSVIQQCLLWIYLIHLFDVLVCADLYWCTYLGSRSRWVGASCC